MRVSLREFAFGKIIAFACILAFMAFMAGRENRTPVTPPVEVTVQDRTNVLLKTCFPAPAFTYKNVDPICESFREYLEDELNKNEVANGR